MASDTVWIPGRNGSPAARAAVTRAGVQPGLTANRAPACHDLVELGGFQHRSCADDGVRHLARRWLLRASRAAAVRKRDLQDRQAALHQRPGQRHGVGHPLDGQHRDDRREGRDGQNIHRQTLQPPSITFTVPVVKAASSLAR